VHRFSNSTAASSSFIAKAGDPHETHYSVQQIAEEWGVDPETVRRVFIDEEGVLILGKKDRRDGKRVYLTVRIPESVLRRVYLERTKRNFHALRNRTTPAAGQIARGAAKADK
jgi:hypothetical protein